MHPSCPYGQQPEKAWWRGTGAVGDPTQYSPIQISRTDRVASAGSCFAQHIRDHLVRRGFNYLVTEGGGPEDTARNYGIFPARFGNIYTTPQLLQLFQRAYGRFYPVEDHWIDRGAYYDPFRPHVEPGGFTSLEALRADREAHLAAVREMFETLDVFIFTMGLTEAWRSVVDGAVFQVCPGSSVGSFDPSRHAFVNFGFQQSCEALFDFIGALSEVNPSARIILTVSPVPLTATMTPHNVIQATVYSKSVLRAVAEEARDRFEHIDYFASYELVTGRPEEFFEPDSRTLMAEGVARVMDLFFMRNASLPMRHSQGAGPVEVACDEAQALAGLADAGA